MTVKFMLVSQPTTINGNFKLDPLWRPHGAADLRGKIDGKTIAPGMYAISDSEAFEKQNPTIQLASKTDPIDPPGAMAALGLTKQAMLLAMGQGDEEDV